MSNIDALFAPENVAVIGASREAEKIGHSIMRNLVEGPFDGEIYPVNPNAETVLGRDCYDSVSDIPETVELGVIAVPAGIANQVVEECVAADVQAVIMVTSGYQEIGGDGVERSQELQDILSTGDTRLLGPNCLGVWDAYSGIDTLFLPGYKLKRPIRGDIAIITQSGSFGSTVMDLLAELEVGVSRFVSYGNQADITEIELLSWLKDDDRTDAIAVYMEGASDGRELVNKARQVTEEMPVIALKAGKHDSGKAAVSSHTGSLAGSYQVYQGAFRQAGILEASSVEELFDQSRALAYNTPLDGDIAVVTNGGGFGVLAADAIESSGMTLATFTDTTNEQLQDVVPAYGNIGNPLDVVGDADPDRFEAALQVVGQDDGVAGVLAIPLLQPVPMESDVLDVLINFREDFMGPFVVCMTGGEFTELHMKNLEQNNIAAYRSPERAAAALKGLHFYGQRQK